MCVCVRARIFFIVMLEPLLMSALCVTLFFFFFPHNISISMYIMCVILCMFSALSRRVGALQISIIIIIICHALLYLDRWTQNSCCPHPLTIVTDVVLLGRIRWTDKICRVFAFNEMEHIVKRLALLTNVKAPPAPSPRHPSSHCFWVIECQSNEMT